MVYAQPRIRPRKRDAQNYLGFSYTNGSPNLDQTTRASDCQQKTEKLPNSGLADHGVKLKVSEKRDKYQDLNRELRIKKLWNMKVTMMPFVIGSLGTITKSGTGELGNKKMSGDYPNNSIVAIG